MERIVIFDAYGTLFKLNTESKNLEMFLGKNQEAFLKLWRSKLLEYTWITSLSSQWFSFNNIIDKALSFTCKVFKLPKDQIAPILMKIYEHPSLFDDAKSLLRHTDFTACIMSNGEQETLDKACDENEISSRIDMVFSASEVERYKVSPQVYRIATAHYNTGPTKMLFVSSNPWDITGASFFGFETIWVNRNNEVFDTLGDPPQHIVNSLEEVHDIIIQLNS